MNTRLLKTLLALSAAEGLLAAGWIWLDRLLTGRGRLTPLLASAACLAIAAGLGALLLRFYRSRTWSERAVSRLDAWLSSGDRLLLARDVLVIGLIFSLEACLLTFIWLPLAARPLTVLGILVFAQAWLALRWACRRDFRAHPEGLRAARLRWRSLEPAQKRTLLVLALIGLVYFGFFGWVNWNGYTQSPETFYSLGQDEAVTYPIAVSMVSGGQSFDAVVYRFLVHEDYHYGYPFYYLSGLVLFGSRLVFGSGFASYTQINLLVLRQLASVLPMMLAILVLVYLVTRFRPTWYSAVMFTVLLLIPGVVRYNQHFWHPDGLQLLFIAMTFYFLRRDRLRFGRDFFYAAVMCALATATKLYGVFFFLAVAGYLAAGLIRKALTVKKAVLFGSAFILVMGLTVLAVSPYLAVPSAYPSLARIAGEKSVEVAQGYAEPDPEGIYQTGLPAWMRAFELHYTRPYFFWFLVAALGVGSLIGGEKALNRLLLAWCLTAGGYLVCFVAVKSYHYLLPLMIPLYAGGFLLPAVLQAVGPPALAAVLRKPAVKALVWGLFAAAVGSQVVLNVIDILSSPYVRVDY